MASILTSLRASRKAMAIRSSVPASVSTITGLGAASPTDSGTIQRQPRKIRIDPVYCKSSCNRVDAQSSNAIDYPQPHAFTRVRKGGNMRTRLFVLGFFLLLFGLPMFGQTFGEITGQVSDSTSA